MGTAREDLLELLGEAMFDTRKTFGMWGGIQIAIADLTSERLIVKVWTAREREGSQVALNVRNAFLAFLRDMLPVERFVVIYDNKALGIQGEVHDLPFAAASPDLARLRSQVILIEANAGPARERLRPRFREAWERLVVDRG